MEKKKYKNSLLGIIFGSIQPIIFLLINILMLLMLKLSTTQSIEFPGIFLDFTIIILIAVIGLILHPYIRKGLYTITTIILSIICYKNIAYYGMYSSFPSLSIEVEKLPSHPILILFILLVVIYIIYEIVSTIICLVTKSNELKLKWYIPTIITIPIVLILTLTFLFGFNEKDWDRLHKLWNREYVVQKFGIIVYTINDISQSVKYKS